MPTSSTRASSPARASLLARLPLPWRGDSGGGGPLRRHWLPGAVAVVVTVAGLVGLGVAIVVVNALDPGGGLSVGGSAALAGRLWLLANGGALRLSSGPMRIAPLLLSLGIAWGLSRGGRIAVRIGGETDPRAVTGTTAVLVAVHTLLVVVLGLVLDAPAAHVDLLRTGVCAAVLGVVAAGWGAGQESGAFDALLAQLPGAARPVLRAVLAGGLTLVACSTAVVAIAVASDARGYAALSGSLGGAGAGAVGLLGLSLLLVPNAAAAVLGLAAGPGFVVGSATVVSVHGVTLGAVPALPLLAGLPDTQAVPLVAFASQAIPALAGLVAGATLGRWLRDEDGGSIVAGLWGILAGLLLGVAALVGVAVAGGSLGDGALAEVGAPALATGIAVAVQAGIAAALAAVVSRWRALG